MLRPEPVYKAMASRLGAYENCIANGNDKWGRKHAQSLDYMQSNFLPSGSGYDNGSIIDIDRGLKNGVMVLHTSFHHMNEQGMYDGWTEHKVFVKPNLLFDFTLTITGEDRNNIKEMMGEEFDGMLHAMVWESIDEDYNIAWHNEQYECLPSELEITESYDRRSSAKMN